MGLRDITREAVLAAIAEYDRLSQDDFLVEASASPSR